MASSRVGQRIRTFIVLVRGTAARASITGIENAKVLPVPVCAVATTSRPSMSGGMACAWTGVGVTNSYLSRLFRNAEQRLNSENCCINCVRFILRRTGTLSVFRIAGLTKYTRLETHAQLHQVRGNLLDTVAALRTFIAQNKSTGEMSGLDFPWLDGALATHPA